MALPLALRVAAPAARPHHAALAAAAVLALAQAAVTLAEPWPLALAVDHAINHRPFTGPLSELDGVAPIVLLILAGVALVVLNGVVGLLGVAGTLLGERAAERIGASLRQATFDRAMSLSLRWHDRMRSGELVSRLTTDVSRILDGITAATTTVLPDSVMVAAVLGVLAAFDPELALVGLAVAPALGLLAVRQRKRVKAAQSQARAESGRLASVSTDLLRNVRAVQAFSRIARARTLFQASNRDLLDADLAALGVEARWSPMADVVLACGSGVVLIVGGARVLSGDLTVGSLLVVLAYLENLYSPVRGLAKLAGALAKAGASAARVQDVLDATDTVADLPHARVAPTDVQEIRFHRVGFRYDRTTPVLHEFNLTVSAGQSVCLFGPSGAGKSTVLHLLLRLYDVDSGRVLLNGLDIRTLDRYSLRKRMAFVPQDPWLLDATIAENIAFAVPRANRAEIMRAGADALVDEFVQSLPHGYDTPVGEAGVRLSGGQRRRVALARAAITQAPIVLLDEPTAGLDAAAAHDVIRAVRNSTATRTVVLITHDRELARIADRIIPVHKLDQAALLNTVSLRVPDARRSQAPWR